MLHKRLKTIRTTLGLSQEIAAFSPKVKQKGEEKNV